jgi:hypothetical protein
MNRHPCDGKIPGVPRSFAILRMTNGRRDDRSGGKPQRREYQGYCHPERSEGSRSLASQILRCAQDDSGQGDLMGFTLALVRSMVGAGLAPALASSGNLVPPPWHRLACAPALASSGNLVPRPGPHQNRCRFRHMSFVFLVDGWN